MTSNPTVRKLTFTGSTEIGTELYKQSAPTIKKLGLELGGNAPFIVFDDADLDAAVEGALIAKYRNNGQTCVCANRIYVQDGVYDAFAEKLAMAVGKLKTGNGFDEGVILGPLIDKAALNKVEEHIADALKKGARILQAASRMRLAAPSSRLPSWPMLPRTWRLPAKKPSGRSRRFSASKSEADVIEQANDTEFGLASYSMPRICRASSGC